MHSLFTTKPFAAHQFNQIGPQIGAEDLMKIIDERGIEEAVNQFNEMMEQSRNLPRYIFEEWVLRDVGYILSANNRTSDAVEIFKLNAKLYPESQETHKDLSTAHTS
jgi:hypothetical protein